MTFAYKPLVFVDVETTGLDQETHEIIEIAILPLKGEVWETKIQPEQIENASPKALEINGYLDHPEDWEGAPTFREVAPEIADRLKNTMVAGQNCLTGDSRVLLADGSLISLQKMVREKHPGPVLSFNEQEKKLEPQPIIGWVKAPTRKFEDWVRIRVRGKGTLRLTKDHQVITARGRVRADHIRIGDRIYTRNTEFTAAQKSLIYGTVAGDAHLSLRGQSRTPRLQIAHSEDQSEYISLKEQILGELVSNTGRCENKRGYGEINGKPLLRIDTRNDPRLLDVLAATTVDGKKRMNPGWMKHLDLPALAIWYCDDGHLKERSRTAMICTHAIGGVEAADLLVGWMRGKGWPVSVYERPDGFSYLKICGPGRWGKPNGIDSFWKQLSPYIPSCMDYKVPPQYRHLCSNSFWVSDHTSTLAWADEVTEVGELFPPGNTENPRYSGYSRKGRGKGMQQYCIAVQNNANFFAEGLCVSNCQFDMNFIQAVFKRYDIPLKGVPYSWVDTVTLAYEHLVPLGIPDLKLRSICNFLGISNEGEHTAAADVYRTREAYLRMIRAGSLRRFWWWLRWWLTGGNRG